MYNTNRNIGIQFSNFDEATTEEGFQGVENMTEEYISEVKEYIATYLLYNVKFDDVEKRKQAINEAFAKICIFFEINDIPLNEENIADKEISAELAEWIAKPKQEIEKIMEIQESQGASAAQDAIQETIAVEEKTSCKCQEHAAQAAAEASMQAKFDKMTPIECLPLALLGIGLAYFLFSTIKFFYYAVAVIVAIYVGSIFYHKWKEKKAQEEAAEEEV